jgi:hypothetical protein
MKLNFSPEQNVILLAVGQYVFAFAYLDTAISFAIVDRIRGHEEATLVTLRGMDFRVRQQRLFKVVRNVDKPPPSADQLEDWAQRLEMEYSFRNDVVHSLIGINTDGSAFLNSFGKGFGQARHVETKISLEDVQTNTQRCWSLFSEISQVLNPVRWQALLATLVDAKDLGQ